MEIYDIRLQIYEGKKMKYLKKFESKEESKEELSLVDIVEIMLDLIYQHYFITITSANGMVYYPDDSLDKSKVDLFKFKRWENEDISSFKIKIDFPNNLGYDDFIKFLYEETGVIVNRFSDRGFYLNHMEPKIDPNSDEYKPYAVEYKFEKPN